MLFESSLLGAWERRRDVGNMKKLKKIAKFFPDCRRVRTIILIFGMILNPSIILREMKISPMVSIIQKSEKFLAKK